jgi:hypothetical protein
MDNKIFVPTEKIISDHLIYDLTETLKELCDKPIDQNYFVKLLENENKSNDNIVNDTTTKSNHGQPTN